VSKTMRDHLNEAIDAALETNAGAHPAIIARQIRDSYPDEFAASAFEQAERQLRSQAQQILSGRARLRQQALPGFELPSVFTVSDSEGGFRYIGMRRGTLCDFDSHTETRRANLEAARAEYELCENQRRECWSVPGAHPGMLVVDAITMLSQRDT